MKQNKSVDYKLLEKYNKEKGQLDNLRTVKEKKSQIKRPLEERLPDLKRSKIKK